jgi:hypothetical protein
MNEQFNQLKQLLDKNADQNYSIRFMGKTRFGDVWSANFKPLDWFCDGHHEARHTLFAKDLQELYDKVHAILNDEFPADWKSVKEELSA